MRYAADRFIFYPRISKMAGNTKNFSDVFQ